MCIESSLEDRLLVHTSFESGILGINDKGMYNSRDPGGAFLVHIRYVQQRTGMRASIPVVMKKETYFGNVCV